MLNKKNRQVTSKLSDKSFEFVKKWCNYYGVSQSSFIQHAVNMFINEIDKLQDSNPMYYVELADYININYDRRRK